MNLLKCLNITAAECNYARRLNVLDVDQLIIDDLSCSGLDIIHTHYPRHHFFSFQLLGYAFTLCCFVKKTFIHRLRLLIYVGKVSCQLTARQKTGISNRVMLFDIAQMPLTPKR